MMLEIMDSLTGVIVVALIFSVPIIAIIAEHIQKMKKMKIEAALRQMEMEKGYAPGTYSRMSTSRKSKKEAAKAAELNEMAEREALEKGIRDLQDRIDNIDLIMKNKKN